MKPTKEQHKPEGGSKLYWRKWYIAVLVALLLQIGLYLLITIHFK